MAICQTIKTLQIQSICNSHTVNFEIHVHELQYRWMLPDAHLLHCIAEVKRQGISFQMAAFAVFAYTHMVM